MKVKFKIKGLDSANCANELENAISKIGRVEDAVINFMTERMELEFDETRKEEIMKKLEKVLKREEPDVSIEEI